MKREGDVVIADAPGGRRIKVKLEGHTLRVKEYANGAERAYYEIRLSGDEYERVKNILKNATSDVEILELFRG